MAIRINTEDNEIIVSDVATEETLRDLLKAVEAMNGAKAGGKVNPEAKKTQDEIKRALRRSEGVELRNFGTFRVKDQKSSIRRNPKTGEKVAVPAKKVISWKMSKEMFKKMNNEE